MHAILVESHGPWVDISYVWLGMDLVRCAPSVPPVGRVAYRVGKVYTLCRVKPIRIAVFRGQGRALVMSQR
jgi:hypothetical protein